MGFRFRKQIKILPGIKLNLSKNGISSVSIGKRGATMNISGKGTKFTAGLPGTGLSFTQTLKNPLQGQYRQQYEQGQTITEEVTTEETFFLCPSCGAPCEWKFAFCTRCGLDLASEKQRLFNLAHGRKEQTKQCPQCKSMVNNDSIFCTHCRYDFVRAVQNDITQNYIELFEDGDEGGTYLALGEMYEKHDELFNAIVCYVYAYRSGLTKEALKKISRLEKLYGYNAGKIFDRIAKN